MSYFIFFSGLSLSCIMGSIIITNNIYNNHKLINNCLYNGTFDDFYLVDNTDFD